MRVLIAEDDQASRMLLQRKLESWDYEVVAADDGSAALKCLQERNAPPIVILDWEMPGANGPEVCSQLRKMRLGLQYYVIIVTARDNKADIVDGLESGANDYVTKPYSWEELHARVRVGQRVVELQQALMRRVRELQDAMSHIKLLQGIIPICMHCRKIRNDQESWQQMESYMQEHADVQFSHGICPECVTEHYPELHNAPRA